VRGAHRERPNPAEARPGISPDDRRILAEHGTAPPTPRNGTVRGTMGKPQLPRRRAQEHIAPQLRDGPTPRQDPDHLVGHDPGLLAAFQRGISLAEAQQHMEAGNMEWGDMESSTHMESSTPIEPAYREPTHAESAHMGSTHAKPSHREPPHRDTAHRDPIPMDPIPMDPIPMEPAHTEPLPTVDAARITEARGARDGVTASRPEHTTTRHDGSAPAG
jgi:hypothetical protein